MNLGWFIDWTMLILKDDAIEFAVKYDDGKDPKGLPKADIVLLGISRTSKTPLSQYLAHKSYKVMNIPIVPEVTPQTVYLMLIHQNVLR